MWFINIISIYKDYGIYIYICIPDILKQFRNECTLFEDVEFDTTASKKNLI